jgi:hypothetical protein
MKTYRNETGWKIYQCYQSNHSNRRTVIDVVASQMEQVRVDIRGDSLILQIQRIRELPSSVSVLSQIEHANQSHTSSRIPLIRFCSVSSLVT